MFNNPSDVKKVNLPIAAGPLKEGEILFNKYKIGKYLGNNYLGFLYSGEDTASSTGEKIIIKVIRKALLPNNTDKNNFMDYLISLKNNKLSGIVSPIDVDKYKEFCIMIRPFIYGISLKYLIDLWKKNNIKFKVEEILSIIFGITRSLFSLKSISPHGSLTPGNIIITKENILLTDSGIIAAINGKNLLPTLVLYREYSNYFPPDYKTDYKVDIRTDIYMLALLLKYLFTSNNNPEIAEHDKDKIPVGLYEVIIKALNPEPEKRPDDPFEYLGEIAKSLDLKLPSLTDETNSVNKLTENSNFKDEQTLKTSKPKQIDLKQVDSVLTDSINMLNFETNPAEPVNINTNLSVPDFNESINTESTAVKSENKIENPVIPGTYLDIPNFNESINSESTDIRSVEFKPEPIQTTQSMENGDINIGLINSIPSNIESLNNEIKYVDDDKNDEINLADEYKDQNKQPLSKVEINIIEKELEQENELNNLSGDIFFENTIPQKIQSNTEDNPQGEQIKIKHDKIHDLPLFLFRKGVQTENQELDFNKEQKPFGQDSTLVIRRKEVAKSKKYQQYIVYYGIIFLITICIILLINLLRD